MLDRWWWSEVSQPLRGKARLLETLTLLCRRLPLSLEQCTRLLPLVLHTLRRWSDVLDHEGKTQKAARKPQERTTREQHHRQFCDLLPVRSPSDGTLRLDAHFTCLVDAQAEKALHNTETVCVVEIGVM